jgi:hypothetical protein
MTVLEVSRHRTSLLLVSAVHAHRQKKKGTVGALLERLGFRTIYYLSSKQHPG